MQVAAPPTTSHSRMSLPRCAEGLPTRGRAMSAINRRNLAPPAGAAKAETAYSADQLAFLQRKQKTASIEPSSSNGTKANGLSREQVAFMDRKRKSGGVAPIDFASAPSAIDSLSSVEEATAAPATPRTRSNGSKPSTSDNHYPVTSDVVASMESSYRYALVRSQFPNCLGVDDFVSRVEAALYPMGFTGDNSIAVTNLCRDEATAILRDKIEDVWGSSFNITGLGGVLTCGQTGFKAGFSHAPVCGAGRERYVFFSFPHIGICEGGEIGAISRPGRPKISHACGALIKALGDLRREGVALAGSITGGVHDVADPEYSILKIRLARRAQHEAISFNDTVTLVDITTLAERAITGDLEKLIAATVDPATADYAVITGVQIHNWATDLDDPKSSSFEFVAPGSVYAVVGGKRVEVDLSTAGPPRPSKGKSSPAATPSPVPREYLLQRLIGPFYTTPKSR